MANGSAMIPEFSPCTALLIRTDDSETVFPVMPVNSIRTISRHIGATVTDTVILSRTNGIPDVVMVVDDLGHAKELPINSRATQLYRMVRPTSNWCIRGDVALVHDSDF